MADAAERYAQFTSHDGILIEIVKSPNADADACRIQSWDFGFDLNATEVVMVRHALGEWLEEARRG